MTPEQYKKVKSEYFDLLDTASSERAIRLDVLQRTDPEVATEVRKLLANSKSKTILARLTEALDVDNTMSNTTVGLRRVNAWLVGGWTALATSLVVSLIFYLMATLIDRNSAGTTEQRLRTVLEQMVTERSQRLTTHVLDVEQSCREFCANQETIKSVREMLKIANSNQPLDSKLAELETNETHIEFRKKLRFSVGVHFRDRASLSFLSHWFEIIQPDGHVIAYDRTSNKDSPITSQVVHPVGELILDPANPADPKLNLTNYFVESKDDADWKRRAWRSFTVQVPIYDGPDHKSIIANMLVGVVVLYGDFYSLNNDNDPIHQANWYLLGSRGEFLSDVRDTIDLIDHLSFQAESDSSPKRYLMALDPGTDLTQGNKPLYSNDRWSPTTPARDRTPSKSIQSNLSGYRDYRGVQVVGAWQDLTSLNARLVLEIPHAVVFDFKYPRTGFLLYWSAIALMTGLFLIALSLLRGFVFHQTVLHSLGSYELQEIIGEGGTSVVYRAEHRLLQRSVAIKLLKTAYYGPQNLKRFHREVRIASQLQSINAVSIHDFGLSSDGHYYCVMELVQGATLAHLLAFEPSLPLNRLLWLLRQVGGVLQDAHDLGLVHRDIKPQNIMVCQSGKICDVAKVVDFGLAKQMESAISGDATATRNVMGTPGFIAPERIETPWLADPRVDIYSFGVVAIYALVRRIPPVGASLELLIAMCDSEPAIQVEDRSNTIHELLTLFYECIRPVSRDRIGSMLEVNNRLQTIAAKIPWDEVAAEEWWATRAESLAEFCKKNMTNGGKV